MSMKKHQFRLPGIALCLCLFVDFAAAQNTKISVQTFKKDTSFTCIASDDNGYVYAGTQTRGLFRYDGTVFKNYTYGLNGLLSWRRTWIRQMTVVNNKLWVAHSGFIFDNLGDVDYYRYGGVEAINILNGPGDRLNRRGQRIINIDLTVPGPNTRNTMAVYADTNNRIWSASDYADSVAYPADYNYNARYWYKTGGVGIMAPGQNNFTRNETAFPSPHSLTPGVGTPGTESNSIGKRKGSQAITPDGSGEMLVSCSGYQAAGDVLFTAGIMRYNRNTGDYIGKYDQNNTPIPFGLSNTSAAPQAMFTDIKGRVWVAIGGGRLAMKDTSGWRYLGVPAVLPAGKIVQPRAISGDKRGRIYIGTDGGLLVYNSNDSIPYADSLFRLYTTADSLPSNYIRGTHVDKNGTVWLATGNGVCKILQGDLLMYNLKPSESVAYNTNAENQRRIVTAFDPTTANPDTIRIGADGSGATLFKWVGKTPQNLKFAIKEDTAGTNLQEFGKLTEVSRTNDSLVIQYRHPVVLTAAYQATGRHEINFQLIDTTVMPPVIVIESKLNIVNPPVLCLHGLWSSGGTYDSLKKFLIENANYKKFMIASPSYTNDVPYAINRHVGLSATENLINDCAANSMSAGQVDVITHSMGGPVSRLFLQSNRYNYTYHKLITLNAPHAGTQNSNFVFANPAIQLAFRTLLSSTNNIDNGALADMAVNSSATLNLLNGAGNLNRNKVPTHAIVSDFTDLRTGELALWSSLLFTSVTIPRATLLAEGVVVLAKLAIYQGTTCNALDLLHNCLKDKIYKDDNDMNVPVESQKGGLPPSAITKFDNIMHTATLGSPLVYNRIKELLYAPETSPWFTTAGFNPPTLTYTGNRQSPSPETVQVVSPASGTIYSAGQTIPVQLTGSTNIQRLLLASGNPSLVTDFADTALQNYTFNYKIPRQAIGRVYLVAIGYDNLGRSTSDTAFIDVTVPAGVTLDSLRIAGKNNLKVFKGDSIALAIKGYYSDTLRNLSNLSGITYTIEDVNVKASTVAPNYIIGVNVGFDKFVATYQGKTDTGYIEIVEKIVDLGGGVIPVTLSSFTGKLVNNSVQLLWVTAQEFNSSHFEIERSFDGARFEKIGQLTSNGYSNLPRNYGFTDLAFRSGVNYYRLKQVDKDGQYSYSAIVLIRIRKDNQQQVLIYPNPANRRIVVNVAEGLHKEWVLNLYTTIGQLVYTQIIPANQNNESITLPPVAPGIYSITIATTTGEKVYNGKLMVQH
jgi:pimeloyl-ACP methyl ester carboxylesterase